jgi:hypothetical protein
MSSMALLWQSSRRSECANVFGTRDGAVATGASQPPDSWAEIETAALEAFAPHVNVTAPRLREVIGRSPRYAKIDRAKRVILIDRREFMLALLAIGLDEALSGSGGIAAWVATWLGDKVSLDTTRLAALEGPAEELLAAFNDKLRMTAAQSMNALLPLAVGYAERTCKLSIADLRHIVAAMLATSYGRYPSPRPRAAP